MPPQPCSQCQNQYDDGWVCPGCQVGLCPNCRSGHHHYPFESPSVLSTAVHVAANNNRMTWDAIRALTYEELVARFMPGGAVAAITAPHVGVSHPESKR